MKNIILLIVILTVIGCSSRKLSPEEKKAVGVYQIELGNAISYWDMRKDGRVVVGKREKGGGKNDNGESNWKIVDGEIHLERKDGCFGIWKINSDDSITRIAEINNDGKRKDVEMQFTAKRNK